MDDDNILDEFKPDILDFLEKIVNINSHSKNVDGNNLVLSHLKNRLLNIGFHVQVVNENIIGSTLVAKNYTKLPEDEQAILLLGHSDTVFPEVEYQNWYFTSSSEKCYGPGVLDMKGGLTQIIFALEILKYKDRLNKPIKIIIASDEEAGHTESNFVDILKKELIDIKYTLCCESGRPDGSFVLGRKGVGNVEIVSKGVEAHAGYGLDKGVNAIRNLTNLIESIYSDKENLSESQQHFNLGVIQGGSEINVVPGYAKAEFDIRFSSENDFYSLINWFRKHIKIAAQKDTKAEFHLLSEIEYPSMEVHCNEELFEKITHLMNQLGMKEAAGVSVTGGADSSHVSSFQTPVICAFGPEGNYNHTSNEFIYTHSLYERIQLLTLCVTDL